MRITTVLTAGLLLLGAASASAQDLQYRVRTHVTMPDPPAEAIPDPETTMYLKGANMRVDTKMPGVSTSMIVDSRTRMMYMLDNVTKTYSSQAMQAQLRGKGAAPDTALVRAMGLVPQVVRTNEKKMIAGFEAVRVVSVQRIPYPSDPSTAMVTVTESWLSLDPRLMSAYNNSMQAAQRMMGPEAQQMVSMLSGDMKGVPLQTTTVAIRRTGSATIDPFAILKDPNPEGLMMKNQMQLVDIKLSALPASLFAVPTDYRKTN